MSLKVNPSLEIPQPPWFNYMNLIVAKHFRLSYQDEILYLSFAIKHTYEDFHFQFAIYQEAFIQEINH